MTIDRLNPLNPVQLKRNQNASRVDRNAGKDSISLSQEAMAKAELFNAMELAKAAPDMRMDKIEEIRAKLNDPNYINNAVLTATAERILDQLL